MGNRKEILASLAVVISLPGFYFSYQSLSWLYDYFQDTGSTVRHEYLIGVFWYALLALLCWIVVSICSFFLSKEIPKAVLVTINIPFVVTALALIYWIFFSVVLSFF
jgi:uncharacterized membrane protein YhaH (DUF805 family)